MQIAGDPEIEILPSSGIQWISLNWGPIFDILTELKTSLDAIEPNPTAEETLAYAMLSSQASHKLAAHGEANLRGENGRLRQEDVDIAHAMRFFLFADELFKQDLLADPFLTNGIPESLKDCGAGLRVCLFLMRRYNNTKEPTA